ncbi:collagen alpha-6(VI) chain-like isoform 2-T2 [Clarias gariepinus]
MEKLKGLLPLFIFAQSFLVSSAQQTDLSTGCRANLADIVFLIDGSGSIGDADFLRVKRFLRTFIVGLDIAPDKVRVGIVQFSNNPQDEVQLGQYADKNDLLEKINKLTYLGGSTETGKALYFILDKYNNSLSGSRIDQNVAQIVVVITDGDSADKTEIPATKLREKGLLIFAIGVGAVSNKGLESIANQPHHHFVFNFTAYEKLLNATNSILDKVCIFVEAKQEALAPKFADVFVLVDSSLEPKKTQKVRQFLQQLANNLTVGSTSYKIALAQFDENVSLEFGFDSYKTTADAVALIRKFQLRGTGKINLENAINYGHTQLITPGAGSRIAQGYKQYLLLLNKGQYDDKILTAIETLMDEQVTLISIDFSKEQATDQQRNYSQLVERTIYAATITPQTIAKSVTTIIETAVKINVTEDCKLAPVADIVFIVDASDNVTLPNFKLVLNFLHDMISGLEVASDGVRVGMVLYSDTPTADFYLNTFDNQTKILQYINLLTFKGGQSKTSEALKFAREKLFIKNTGSRHALGVQQIAVVITAGDSLDNVTFQADSLRRSGVEVYVLGVTKDNVKQLNEIASHPPERFVFSVESFTKLKTMEKPLRKTLCNNLVRSRDKSIGYSIEQGCVQTEEADIYFLIDQSTSIDRLYFEDMKKFILEVLLRFTIGPNQVRVGVVKYSDNPTVEFKLNDFTDKKSLTKAVISTNQNYGNTHTGAALSSMGPLFKEAEGNRNTKVQKILIVITDGESQDKVTKPAEELRTQGVTIYAIGVKNANKMELLEIAGDQKRMYFVNNFDALKSLKENIIKDICSSDACKNMKQADIVFLIDGSGSIHDEDFSKMKKFMNNVISKSVIGQDSVQIGVVQFSSYSKDEFPLNQFSDKLQMQKAINDTRQLGGGTMTGAALSTLLGYFDPARGGRPSIPQILIVITDGESQDAVAQPAQALRDKGIAIYSIGVHNANSTQLQEISGTSDRVFFERNFAALDFLHEDVLIKVCTSADDCQKSQVADVVFLVDDSGSISNTDFLSMKLFMNSVVNTTKVGKDNVRLCTILYSDTPRISFPLNRYFHKQEVRDAINDLKHTGGNTYTAMALHYSLDYFNEPSGGRGAKGVPQMLFVITDGEATDSTKLPTAADELQKHKISVYGIGVGKAKTDELETITKDKSKVFHVGDFNALNALKENISRVICSNTKPECEKEKADLVILIDGSGSIKSPHWTIMINFTLSLIDNLRIKQDLFRVGVAQFSTHYRKEFYLNEYNNTVDVKNAIQNISQIGGGTDIAKALNEVQEFFHTSKGSRIQDGISQNLLFITDGESENGIKKAADRLRLMGVEIFVIGIGDINPQQLNIIAGSQKRLYTINSFDHLKLNRTTQQVISTICTSQKDPEGCTVHIGIGFDVFHSSSIPQASDKYKPLIYVPEIIKSISTLESLCCVSMHRSLPTNIGFHLVDANGNIRYDTNFEDYNEDIVEKVMNQNIEGRAFNTKLLRSFQDKFATSGAGVKVMVIFTDGLDAFVNDLMVASEKLRKSGVHALIPIALKGGPHVMDLQKIGFGRVFGSNEPLTVGMHNVGRDLRKQIGAVALRECCNVMCKCTGHEGVQGLQGPPGTKGFPGRAGYPGFPGEDGGVGERGPEGLNGSQGHPGCQGKRGLKGGRGFRGDTGIAGEHGVDGVNGEQGVAGLAGYPGEPGDPGSQGKRGVQGIPGEPGQKGLRGDPGLSGIDNSVPGPKGEIGNPGLLGVPGTEGNPGRGGDTGHPGQNGRRGAAGPPGNPGPSGETGSRGNPGPSGPQGPQGPTGDSGQQGTPGFQGPQGSPGTQGNVGSKGSVAPRGQKGQPGEPGNKGVDGPLGNRGLPGNDGPDGYGSLGPKGQKGDPGFPGYPGQQGELGDPGKTGGNGTKGREGRRGNAGRQGEQGDHGSIGPPGQRGPKGPPGPREMSACELISYVRDNCACCKDKAVCPVYPTELVIGLDVSEDMTSQLFERMRSTLFSLLDTIDIAESNCPTGTRVAVVSYSSNTKYLIHFSDYRRKKDLLEAVKNIPLTRTSNRRNIGAAMRFVGRNVFKRIRQGVLIRKVAIFLSGGQSQDVTSITTAVLEYKALDINLGVIGFKNTPNVQRAFQADETESFINVVEREGAQGAALKRIQRCIICYDPCNPARDCPQTTTVSTPKEVDIDLAMLVDGSRSIQADQYQGVKEVLRTVLDQLIVSDQPSKVDTQARVALYQQSSSYSEAQAPVKQIFTFQQFKDRNQMKHSISVNLQQTGGYSRLGHAVEFVIRKGLLTAPKPRKKKMVLLIVGGETEYSDRAKLDVISMMAKCQGVVLLTLTVGDHFNYTQVEELASLPTEQHIVPLGHVKQGEQEYSQRFIRTFLHILSRDMITYPPPLLKKQCENQDIGVSSFDRSPSSEKETVIEHEEHSGIEMEHGYENDDPLSLGHEYLNDVCYLKKEKGPCRKYIIKWYYNQEQNKCSRFLYGGCDGNFNRFDTHMECEAHCVKLPFLQ